MRASRLGDVLRRLEPRFSLRTMILSIPLVAVPFLIWRSWGPWYFIRSESGELDLVLRHPEAWWGVFWLPAFYVSALIVLGYAWSVWTDVQVFAPKTVPLSSARGRTDRRTRRRYGVFSPPGHKGTKKHEGCSR
jgi:hypothetical protein